MSSKDKDKDIVERIKEDKIQLAERCLEVAKGALEDIDNSLAEATVKDLVSVFNAAVKAHRELVSDIVSMEDPEADAEKKLAPSYTSKVDELLGKLKASAHD